MQWSSKELWLHREHIYPCPYCGGSGETPHTYHHTTCEQCKGTGEWNSGSAIGPSEEWRIEHARRGWFEGVRSMLGIVEGRPI